MPSVEAECSACNATGLYCGFAEPEGTAVICHGCGGTGRTVISYKPFEKRRRKRNVQRVLANNVWFTRKSGEPTISIEEFYHITEGK